jgi:hypothetical protein
VRVLPGRARAADGWTGRLLDSLGQVYLVAVLHQHLVEVPQPVKQTVHHGLLHVGARGVLDDGLQKGVERTAARKVPGPVTPSVHAWRSARWHAPHAASHACACA